MRQFKEIKLIHFILWMKKKKGSSILEKLQNLLELESKPLEKWLTTMKYSAIKHLPDIENLINKVFNTCADKLNLIQSHPEEISYILEYPQKSNWMIFLDKLNTCPNQNILVIILLQTLVQELISKEKEYKPFWTPAYKELSEKLWLPTKTGLADLDMTSSKALSLKQVEKLPCLTIQKQNHQNKSSQMTSFPLSISSVVDKWEKENTTKPIKYRTIAVKVQLSTKQKQLYKQYSGCFRYVYNRALHRVKNLGEEPNFQELRNLIVTQNTKMYSNSYKYYSSLLQLEKEKTKHIENPELLKQQKEIIKEEEILMEQALKQVPERSNPCVSHWERLYNKDIRSNAVNKLCDAYKTAKANLKAGNIKFFNIQYMTSKNPRQCFELSSSQISIKKNNIHLPCFKECSTLKVSKKMAKKLRNLEIKHNCDFVKQKNSYWILIPVPVQIPKISLNEIKYCGVDPGVVKIATCFGNTGITEYTHNRNLLSKYNDKLSFLKTLSVRKKQIDKIEKKKIDYTNNLHWKLINSLLDNNDVVFFGDIKSHDIVKKGGNSSLNQEFNDLKFYLLKQRLIYKSKTRGKKIILVNERYTSMTCSFCGEHEKPNDRIYSCKNCNITCDRDINASKNILMRGILCM